MSEIFPKTKIADNGKCTFYTDHFTQSAETWAKEWGLKNYRCMLAEQNDTKELEYILIEGNDVVYCCKAYEALAVHIDIVALSKGLKREDHW